MSDKSINVPEGWKLVPVEPTVEMAAAILNITDPDELKWPDRVSPNFALSAYRAMVAASPSAPEAQGEPGAMFDRFIEHEAAKMGIEVRRLVNLIGSVKGYRESFIDANPAPSPSPVLVEDEAEFEIHSQDGVCLAGTSGLRDAAWDEIRRYAAQYMEEGPLTIYEVKRTPVAALSSHGDKGGSNG